MLFNTKTIKFLVIVFAIVFSTNLSAAAQSLWLDLNPLPSWNERKRAILQTKKISPAELKRCAVAMRPPTLPQDQLLTRMGWTVVGPAHVFGRTTVVTVAEAFDGMCRPLQYDAFVFVGNRVAGTLSPGQMDSRTDGSLVNAKLTGERNLTAEYVRYRDSDPLCCPYKTEAVTFVIKPDGPANFLLVPETKVDATAANNGGNQPQAGVDALKNTVWRWESAENFQGKLTIDKPENYQIEFMPNNRLNVKADCNRGGGSYRIESNKIELSKIFTTKMACQESSLERRFLQGLGQARTFLIEGNALLLEGAGDNASMRFFKVTKQN